MKFQPKTDWKYNDTPTEADFNRIEQGISDALEGNDPIIQQETPPDGIKEGRLWLDTSDNTYQGTVFESIKEEFGAHLAEKASINGYGHTKLSSSIDSDSESMAATPKAVKAAYDYAKKALSQTKTFIVANGESVNKGDAVQVDKDGCLRRSKNSSPIPNFADQTRLGKQIVNQQSPHNHGVVKLTDALSVYLVQIRGGGDGSVYKMGAIVCRLNVDDTITEGVPPTYIDMNSPLLINSPSYVSLARLNDTMFFYAALLNGSNYLEIGIGYVNPDTLELSYITKKTIVNHYFSSYSLSATELETNTVALVYRHPVSAAVVLRIIKWDGLDLIVGNENVIKTIVSATTGVKKLDDNKLLVFYNNFAHVVTTNNGEIVVFPQVTLSMTPHLNVIYPINKNRVVLKWGQTTYLLRVNEDNTLTEINSVIGYNTSLLFKTANASFIEVNTGVMAGIYYDEDEDILVRNTIGVPLDSSRVQQPVAVWLLRDRVIFHSYTNTYTPRYDIGSIVGDNVNVVGIASENKREGESCVVTISGIVEGFEGLVTGSRYAAVNSVLTRSFPSGGNALGKSVSETELLLF
ncbi:tail fiber protein [Cytobacillus solani]|uniref:tail fiber protein n=1 Tax=Cytobacillus solani TaxID=1637975 RepID=UPI0011505F5C|nr:tail fiber protein [Cytobacillus solani]